MIVEVSGEGVLQCVTLFVHQCVHLLDMDRRHFYLCTVSSRKRCCRMWDIPSPLLTRGRKENEENNHSYRADREDRAEAL